MERIKLYLWVICLTFSPICSHGQSVITSLSADGKILYIGTDSKVALSSCILFGLGRWRNNHENWETKADSILQTQRVLDSVVSFTKRYSYCSYVITNHVTARWKSIRPWQLNRSSKILKDYLVWNGVDSMSLWLALDTIPNPPSLVSDEYVSHYHEIIKVENRQFSGWLKEGRNKYLPNAYLYGFVMDNCFGGQQKIGRSDSMGHFECSVPNVPMTIIIQDENHSEKMRFNLKEGGQIDKKIRIPRKRGRRKE